MARHKPRSSRNKGKKKQKRAQPEQPKPNAKPLITEERVFRITELILTLLINLFGK